MVNQIKMKQLTLNQYNYFSLLKIRLNHE